MNFETLTLNQTWDKTFPKDPLVEHRKVSFHNRYGITLAADLYMPQKQTASLPAIAVCGPFGAVKEQCSGLYAQTMAKKGFIALAFDPSFTGESGGNVRGYFDSMSAEDRYKALQTLNEQRTKDYESNTYARAGGVVDPLPEDAPFFVKDYYDYYKTPRGYHPRSLNSNDGWNVTSSLSFMNMKILSYSEEINSAVLMIHGEKAHSCYFSKDAFQKLKGENKELMIIPDAVHTDLYDQIDVIPFDKISDFFHTHLQ